MSGNVIQISSMSATAFLNTIGVNTHIAGATAQYANSALDLSELNYLNVKYVRDFYDPANESVYTTLGQSGIKFDILTYGSGTTADTQGVLSSLDQLNSTAPGVVAAVEGPNEINQWPTTYNGQTGLNAAIAYQKDLYSLAHADSSLPGVVVYYFTGYGMGGNAQGPNPATTPGLADFDTAHPYPQSGIPPLEGVLNTSYALNPLRSNALSNENPATGPAVYTETGYANDGTTAGGYAVAVGDVELLLDDAQQGIAKTYLYELQEEGPNSGNGSPGFGLFNAGQPTQGATAIHNLTTLLGSSGTSTAAGIGYSVSGLPSSTGHSMEFTGANGTSYIAIWNENWQINQSTPPTPVTVSLSGKASVAVYDPILSATAMQTLTNVSTISLTLTGDPIILKVGSSSNTPTPTPTPSPNGTTIKSATAAPIIDQAGNAWSLVQSTSVGLQIAVNGVVDPITSNVVLLETLNGNIEQENTSNNWYSKSAPSQQWTQIPPPSITVTNTATSQTTTFTGAVVGTKTVAGEVFVLTAPGVAKVTLGTNPDTLKFTGLSSVTLTGGTGAATVTDDGGNNTFTGGIGALVITGGVSADAYIYHAGDGLMTLKDFSFAKGDSLTVDKSLQGSLTETSDGHGGVIIGFGTSHGMDLVGVTSIAASQIHFV